jgi:peptide/nickel transport system permease protein
MASDASTTVDRTLAEPKRRPFLVDLFIRLWKEKPLGTVGLAIVLILLFTGIFADWLAPYPISKIDLFNSLAPSSAQHWLGTDQMGRDLLSRIIYGARVSVIIGLSASLLSTVVSIIIGALSALIGGIFDLVVQRFVDAFLCIPGMLILLIMMSILGNGTAQAIMVIGIPMGIGGSRMIRSAVFAIKENTYVEAGRAIGSSTWSMLIRHIIPNIMPVIIIGFSMMIGGAILMEASLSFLGYGVSLGVPSWGNMLSREGRIYMEIAPTLALWPGLALTLVVFGTNVFGDAMRDLLDPKLKGGLGLYGGPRRRTKIRSPKSTQRDITVNI